MKKLSLNKLFNRKDCLGWAWACKGKRDRYVWHNSNDLGLLCDIGECTYEETVLKKVKVCKRGYIYILRNNYGLDEECMGDSVTMPQLKACIKECWCEPLTDHERKLVERANL